MFSIIIPLYNKESTIYNTIKSVLEQTFKIFELIVVNDGSVDNSLKKVNEFRDSRIKIINQKNQGVSVARNRGINEAKYEWVALLDADDLWERNYLGEIFQAIKEFPHKNIFSSSYNLIFPNETKTYSNIYIPKEEIGVIDYIEAISVGEGPINSSNSIINKKLLINSGLFKAGRKNYEDHDLWLRLYERNGIVFINKPLVRISRELNNHASSLGFSSHDFTSYLETIYQTKLKIKDNETNSKLFKKFYNRYCINILLRYSAKYNKLEKKNILKIMSQLLEGNVLMYAKYIMIFNLSNPFNFLNDIRRKYFSK